jgi:tetratricopeptide (TPR) repeat protein
MDVAKITLNSIRSATRSMLPSSASVLASEDCEVAMRIIDRLFKRGKPDVNPTPANPFRDVPQAQLNNLASILPMVLELIRVPHSQTIIIQDLAEAQVHFVRSLSDAQFTQLMEIQEMFRKAQLESDSAKKLKLYEDIVERAPWHAYAAKSLGVVYYMTGNRRKALELLKRAAVLAPNDANILTNLRRVESER